MASDEYIATTVHGFEDLAAAEIERAGGRILHVDEGKVLFRGDSTLPYILNYGSRTLHRVGLLLLRGEFERLEDIERDVRSLDLSWCIDPSLPFEVRFRRKGDHDFTSMDANAAVGRAIMEGYEAVKGERLRVNLSEPSVSFRGWIIDNRYYLSVDLTGRSLHKRSYRVYEHPAPLKSTLASLLVMWSGWTPDKSLVDPMAGSGTILVEAAYIGWRYPPNADRSDFLIKNLPFHDENMDARVRETLLRRVKRVPLRILGVEKYPKHVNGCRNVLQKAGVDGYVKCIQGLCEHLHRYVDGVDYVVTNPPYGLRVASARVVRRLYADFATELKRHFPGTVLVLITPRTDFEDFFTPLEKRRVSYGDLTVNAYRFRVE